MKDARDLAWSSLHCRYAQSLHQVHFSSALFAVVHVHVMLDMYILFP